MSNKVQTVDIIRSLVALMGVTVLLDTITDNGDDTYTIETNNTYWLQPTFVVTIGGVDYTIDSVVRNTSFVLSGSTTVPTAASFILPEPYYAHGTLIETGIELAKEDIKEITPMIYCLEPIRDEEQAGDSALDRESNITLYFITQANFKDWLTADFLAKTAYTMRALADRFIEVCKASSLIGKIEKATRDFTNIYKMTVKSTSQDGKNMFSTQLSGVMLEIPDFPITKLGCSGVVNLSSSVTIVNSDGSFSVTTPNNSTYTLPDINVSDTFGNDLGNFPAAVDVTIVSAIGLDVDFSADDLTAEVGVPIIFTPVVIGGTATIWHWDFGDGTLSHDETPSKTYTIAGTYTVKLLASNSVKSGVQVKTAYITVSDTIAPSGYSIAFGADSYDPITIPAVSIIAASCEVGASYNYSISSSGGGTPVTGSGTVASSGFTISNINCSGLGGGTLTVTFYLTDTSGNQGANVTDTATFTAYDADAVTFFTAAGITDNTQKDAINVLVLALKAAGIWTKMKAIYPMVGGAAGTHKWNLKDPRDLDAAYRLTFFGGWTHDANGAIPNGTNAYANTHATATLAMASKNDCHLSFYSRSDTAKFNSCQIGEITGSGETDILVKWSSGIFYANLGETVYSTNNVANTNSQGYYIISRNAVNTIKGYKNGTLLINGASTPANLGTYEFYISARNSNGTLTSWCDRQCAFATIGDGLSTQQVSDLQAAVQAFQTTLGRQV